MLNLDDLNFLKRIKTNLMRPEKPRIGRRPCFCSTFIAGDKDSVSAFIRCNNCGGWISYERLINEGTV